MKVYTVNKLGFVYRLNKTRLKETHCACASKQVLKTCFGPLIGASGFAQFTIKEKQNTIFVQNSNFMPMRSN